MLERSRTAPTFTPEILGHNHTGNPRSQIKLNEQCQGKASAQVSGCFQDKFYVIWYQAYPAIILYGYEDQLAMKTSYSTTDDQTGTWATS